MSRDGSGTYARSQPDYQYFTAIDETKVNDELDDIATALTGSIAANGETPTTAVVPFAFGVKTDTVAERTAATGVTVDGVLLKDGRIDTTQGADIASATTVNLETMSGNYGNITGTTTITTVTLSQGHQRWVKFAGILTFTHGASLILPTGANITTAAGDTALLVGEAASVVRCVAYNRADGSSLGSADLVNDTTPQLGGDLDLNGNAIDFPTTANIADCLDDDTMAAASAVTLATSESIKAYSDAILVTANAYTDTEVSGVAPTKEFQVQNTLKNGASPPYTAEAGNFPLTDLNSAEDVSYAFHIPSDFTSITEAVILVRADATETITYDLLADYAAAGEASDTHTGSAANETASATATQLLELDVSGVLASLAADDYVGLVMESDTASIWPIMLRFRYS